MNTIEEKIMNFLNGTLPEIDMKEMERLIDEDPLYGEAFERIIRLNDELDELLLPEAPAGLADKIVDQYNAVMVQKAVIYVETQAERRLDKVFTTYLLAAPVLMFLLYFGMALAGKQISFEGLGNGLKSSWIVWTLILLNIIFVVRLLRTQAFLKHNHHL